MNISQDMEILVHFALQLPPCFLFARFSESCGNADVRL
jgi:hypothetical protein